MPPLSIIDPECAFLSGHNRNVTSQYGEDGLIAELFRHIGIVNRWCFEVGAGDGVRYSNTQQWIRQGWNAVLIEADEVTFAELLKHETDKVQTVHERITSRSLDRILAEAGAPLDMDLGVIDIDMEDFWAWVGLQTYRPRVMMVEAAVHGVPAVVPTSTDLAGRRQSGSDMIQMVGEAKGYRALARTHCNVIFCREDVIVQP